MTYRTPTGNWSTSVHNVRGHMHAHNAPEQGEDTTRMLDAVAIHMAMEGIPPAMAVGDKHDEAGYMPTVQRWLNTGFLQDLANRPATRDTNRHDRGLVISKLHVCTT